MRIKNLTTLALVAFVVLALFAGVVQAQVAAPRLNAAAVTSTSLYNLTQGRTAVSPFNPAVLPWSDSHRAGIGAVQLETKSKTLGVKDPDQKSDGKFLQARYAGDAIGVHIEGSSTVIKSSDATVKDTTETTGSIGLSVQANETFSLGYANTGIKIDDGIAAISIEVESNGITLRKDNLYLGVAKNEVKVLNQFALGENFMWGLAYKDESIHAEYYFNSYSEIGVKESDDTNGVTVEFTSNDLLVGYERLSTSFGFDKNIESTTETITLGIKPEKGWTAAASFYNAKYDDPNPLVLESGTTSGISLGIAQQF